MAFEEWIIENDYGEDGKYPSQYYYSSIEWDDLYVRYTDEIGGN